MRKFIQNKLKDQKGLTLIELLAVIVILAIIAAIAIPAIAGIIQNSRVGAIKSDATNVINASELYVTGGGVATTGTPVESILVSDLISGNYLEDAGSIPGTATVNLKNKTINGTGTLTGSVEVVFVNATKADIANYSNSDRAIKNRAAITGPPAIPAGSIDANKLN
ncbi:MAG: prepilin-type N-terminal cleavage/methylation domain-containing protein [Psychrobacillus psychrotolerans]